MEKVGFRKHYQMTGQASDSQGLAKGTGVKADSGKSGPVKNAYNKPIAIPKGGSANVKEAK